MPLKRNLFRSIIFLREVSAVPAANESQVMPSKNVCERAERAWVGVPQFSAFVTGVPHVAQDYFEGNIAGEVGKIVVAPNNRIRADTAAGEEGRRSVHQ